MHWVTFVVVFWFSSSLLTVMGLFWLCRKSAKTIDVSIPNYPAFKPRVVSKPEFQTKKAFVEVPVGCDIDIAAYAETHAMQTHSHARSA